MNSLIRFIPLLIFLLPFVVGCSTTYTVQKPHPPPAAVSSTDPAAKPLIAHFREWEGTPYKMGGQSKNGIDCSGYIQLAYLEVFNRKVPRTTEELSVSGHQVADHKRRFGDLLVFNTGLTQKHVGIYIGNRQFIHASSSKGVTVSSLDNPYWSRKYRQSRRVAD
ncbi:NlpC/P60 family protein [Motiliproteus sp. SC1-56]|uniref:NlpC/P60 family protein n=1 Tax=Motiliproteus sp. SC1-56 TaxID=2799565 RepID=UPI001A8F5044|nr:NlpC/P60 family protein [Motiliproteus sp. SC1-56]